MTAGEALAKFDRIAKKRGLTDLHLAAEADVDPSTVRDWREHEGRRLQRRTAERVAEALRKLTRTVANG